MKRKTKEQFIEEARKVHGDRYDYSKVEYVNDRTKVCIVCPKHGEFWQYPHNHLNSQGCAKCGSDKRTKTTEDFIREAREIHGDKYDYSKVEYKHSKKEVCIICPKHGEFWQTPNMHLRGNGCPKCGIIYLANKRKLTTEEFVEKAVKIHGDKYDYSKVEYIDAHTKVCIICPEHGEFWQDPNNHLNGSRCPKCKKSKYELEIMDVLEKNSINHIFQYRNKKILGNQTFDFYLTKHNVAIECQGEQHFKPIDFGGKGKKWAIELFKNNKQRDEQKIRKCKENGIKLIHYNPFEKYFGTYENEVHNMEELEKLLLT